MKKVVTQDDQPFDWVTPWLDESGCVWVYRGYGVFVLLPPDHEYARLRMRVLDENRLIRESEAKRLRTQLDIEAAWSNQRRMLEQLETLLGAICT